MTKHLKTMSVLAVAGVVAAGIASVSAHHSTTMFDHSKTLTVNGDDPTSGDSLIVNGSPTIPSFTEAVFVSANGPRTTVHRVAPTVQVERHHATGSVREQSPRHAKRGRVFQERMMHARDARHRLHRACQGKRVLAVPANADVERAQPAQA